MDAEECASDLSGCVIPAHGNVPAAFACPIPLSFAEHTKGMIDQSGGSGLSKIRIDRNLQGVSAALTERESVDVSRGALANATPPPSRDKLQPMTALPWSASHLKNLLFRQMWLDQRAGCSRGNGKDPSSKHPCC